MIPPMAVRHEHTVQPPNECDGNMDGFVPSVIGRDRINANLGSGLALYQTQISYYIPDTFIHDLLFLPISTIESRVS